MAMSKVEKEVVLVGVDDSEHGYYALEWALDHSFTPYSPNSPFRLIVLYVEAQVRPYLDIDVAVRSITARVVEKAKHLFATKLVNDAEVEVLEGDARYVLCEAVEKHHASILVVGSHGYGSIKRAFLGSVSDYCVHHAHCNVLIVKKPKIKK